MKSLAAYICFVYFSYTYGQIIPEFPPAPVGDAYTNFAACDGTPATNDKVFCNAPVEDNCKATETVRCMGPNTAITDNKCSGETKYCLDALTKETSGTPSVTVAKYAGNAVCSTKPSQDSKSLIAGGTTVSDCEVPQPQKPSFTCKSIGIVPSPDNCQKYYHCSSDLKEATEFTCPEGYAFDPSLPDDFPCRHMRGNSALCITAAPCVSISAIKLNYQYLTAAMGQIGVFCIGTLKFVYRCGPNTQFKLDTNLKPICDITCSVDGQRFADPFKVSSYYVCTLNLAANAYIKLSYNCPSNYVFDAKKNECIYNVSTLSAANKKLEKYDDDSCKTASLKLKCT